MNISRVLLSTVILAMLLAAAGCGQPLSAAPAEQATTVPGVKPKKTYKDLIVGYVQLGDESDWRSANTGSVVQAAAQLGVELRFSNAQQKQENQISAIRSLIAQQVDVIGIAPLIETGWDDVFKEAKDAFEKAKVKLHPTTSFPIILGEAISSGKISGAQAEKIKEWFSDPHNWASKYGFE